jgi:glycosyltransferase involved in cell wall biosynthesis
MRPIYSGLSNKELDLYEVEVLLATFNGEPFLGEFLDSLSSQVGVRIHLRVSDDGSTDKTLDIVKLHKHKFESCTIIDGPGKGPSLNFLFLLSTSSADYLAFADQDDIWLPEHLVNSISRINLSCDSPAMTFSQVIEWDESKELNTIWPQSIPTNSIKMYFAQNYARGCTVVLNRAMAELIKSAPPQSAIMHDWWVFLIGATCGQAIFEPNPEVIYRLHGRNFIGVNRKSSVFKLLTHQRSTKVWKPLAQVVELKSLHEENFSPVATLEVNEFIQGFTGNFRERLRYATKVSTKLRLGFLDQIKIRIGIIVFPFFFKES